MKKTISRSNKSVNSVNLRRLKIQRVYRHTSQKQPIIKQRSERSVCQLFHTSTVHYLIIPRSSLLVIWYIVVCRFVFCALRPERSGVFSTFSVSLMKKTISRSNKSVNSVNLRRLKIQRVYRHTSQRQPIIKQSFLCLGVFSTFSHWHCSPIVFRLIWHRMVSRFMFVQCGLSVLIFYLFTMALFTDLLDLDITFFTKLI
jgi:hypothetical protein